MHEGLRRQLHLHGLCGREGRGCWGRRNALAPGLDVGESSPILSVHEQPQGGDALLHTWPEGVPSGPAQPVTRSWLEAQPPCLRGHLWFGTCGLSRQRCLRWTSGREPVTSFPALSV